MTVCKSSWPKWPKSVASNPNNSNSTMVEVSGPEAVVVASAEVPGRVVGRTGTTKTTKTTRFNNSPNLSRPLFRTTIRVNNNRLVYLVSFVHLSCFVLRNAAIFSL